MANGMRGSVFFTKSEPRDLSTSYPDTTVVGASMAPIIAKTGTGCAPKDVTTSDLLRVLAECDDETVWIAEHDLSEYMMHLAAYELGQLCGRLSRSWVTVGCLDTPPWHQPPARFANFLGKCAGGGNRTHTGLVAPQDFKSCASASFATPASCSIYCTWVEIAHRQIAPQWCRVP